MKNPTCKKCGEEMRLRKTMSGLQYQCDTYYKCGTTIPKEKWKKNHHAKNVTA